MDLLLLPLLLIAVFYFLLIRPQQKQRRQMAEMQRELAVGSKVMTTAGLIATVASLNDDEDEVELEVSPGVTNRYVRRAIARVIESPVTEDEISDDTPDGEAEDASSRRDDADGHEVERKTEEKAQNSANDADSR